MMLGALAMVFVQGLGLGSDRLDVFMIPAVFFGLNILSDVITGKSQKAFTAPIEIWLISLAIYTTLFCAGFVVGRKFFREG